MADPSVTSETGFRPPLLAGRYVVHLRLGKGASAGVYLVYDLKLQTWRASKVMHPSAAQDPEQRHRFAREAVIMARLDHPNVVRVVDVATDVALPYLVMELLEGGSAVRYVKRQGPMHPATAARVCHDLCLGLGALHELDGIHRDVKPHNVLFDRDGRAKLTDFGIARLGPAKGGAAPSGDLDDHSTEVGTVMGTMAYMAPEQRVDASRVDARADVFGVAATLFSLLTASSAADLCMIEADDPRLATIPPPLRKVLLVAAAYRPRDRYRDAEAMAEALGALDLAPAPKGTPPLVGDIPTLPSQPATRLGAAEVKGLTELITAGVIEATYDPHDIDSGPSLRPRIRTPAPAPVRQYEEDEEDTEVPDPPSEAEVPPPAPAPPPGLPPPEPAASVPPGRPAGPRRTLGTVLLGLVTALVLTVMFVLLIAAAGSWSVSARAAELEHAQESALMAEEQLFDLIEANQPVVQELGVGHTEQADLQRVLQTFLTARAATRAVAAEAYLTLLTDTFRRATTSSTRMTPTTRATMGDLTTAWDANRAAWEAWEAARDTASAKVAIQLGLSPEDRAPPR